MKKSAILLALFLISSFLVLVSAVDNETSNNQTTTSSEEDSKDTKLEEAFDCLEEKADDCSDLTTQEIAVTIMATPNDDVFDSCVDELEDRESSNNWGSVIDTSLAIIALNHAGKDTEASEEWLLEQNKTPTDLIWYIQEDSDGETQCNIGYDSNDYTITINEDKKINKNAGSCLSRAQSNFWLEINNDCYGEKFKIECDEDFIANLIYRNKNSPTIYVLEGTSSAPAFGSVELQVKAQCFGAGSSCDYESTVWATIALLETSNDVEDFIPYIIAMSETNKKYLPEAFSYILTGYEDYATSLIEEQELGNYWEADSSAYNKYYDTSLALLALSSSNAEQVKNAKDWLWFSQGSNGCWQNSVLETAMVLWALEGRSGKSSDDSTSVTYCTEAGYFCITSLECPTSEDVGDNYFCPSLSDTCCITENLKTCTEYGGQVCTGNKVCTGNSRKASDTDSCCTGSCEDRIEENECEANFYTCMDECSEYQEPMDVYSCDLGQVCCRTKTASSDSGSSWWIWVLIILILIVLGILAYIYREKLKLYWFQIKTKFKKDKGKGDQNSSTSGPSIPPRPGFPPIRRPSPASYPVKRTTPQNNQTPQRRYYDRRDKTMSDTFQKLREMSK